MLLAILDKIELLNMFSIKIIDKERSPMRGQITINDFTEEFEIYPFDRSEDDITRYWKSQLQSLLTGDDFTILQYDPRFAWIVYKNEDICYIQNVMALDGNFNIHKNRRTKSDGASISEWITNISSIKTFLKN